MDDQNKNIILATALSFIVILVWFVLFPPPEPQTPLDASPPVAATSTDGSATVPSAPADALAQPANSVDTTNTQTTANAPRVPIETDRLSGSISLLGGRIDDLNLNDYRVALDDSASVVTLLSPVGSTNAHYALYGWAPAAGMDPAAVPGPNTEWALAQGRTLGVGAPVTLEWSNGQGQTFSREISVDENFLFSVTQSVNNTGASKVNMAPYGLIARHGEPEDLKNFFILHEGVVAMADGELSEIDWSDIPDYEIDPRQGARAETIAVQENGWIGFTDHYWMSTLIPEPGSAFRQVIKYDERRDIYQTEAVLPTRSVAPGETVAVT
ncbi:MAG: membrane protein insertase YidC, partial [Tateyamaria sp.]|nr:membrane protein insertase YidC [Tateyamaria sp.]